jgi:hypothetical protein
VEINVVVVIDPTEGMGGAKERGEVLGNCNKSFLLPKDLAAFAQHIGATKLFRKMVRR